MKELVRQFYTEGLANVFLVKPSNFINRKVKNKTLNKILNVMIKVLYTICAIMFGLYIFYTKLPR